MEAKGGASHESYKRSEGEGERGKFPITEPLYYILQICFTKEVKYFIERRAGSVKINLLYPINIVSVYEI